MITEAVTPDQVTSDIAAESDSAEKFESQAPRSESVEPERVELECVAAVSVESVLVESVLVESVLVEAASVDPASVDRTSVDRTSEDPASVDPAVKAASVDVTNVKNDIQVESSPEAETLSLSEAALILGKSMRALERSLSGKWGNRLPDGWTARKKIQDGHDEWRILPPEGFRVDKLLSSLRKASAGLGKVLKEEFVDYFTQDAHPKSERSIWTKGANELMSGRNLEMVELLRELAKVHKALAEEQKTHMEDLKLLNEVQGSMRLLEVNQVETAQLKSELLEAQRDLVALKNQYQQLLSLPWWKRIFIRRP